MFAFTLPEERPLRLGVLVSGAGTNLQALLDHYHGGTGTAARVACVGSTRADAPALARAVQAGVPTGVFVRAPDRDARLADWLAEHRVALVVCAGWLGILGPELLDRFPAINVHPSLLPAFPGADAIGDALRHGVRITGVTVHLVDAGLDSGPVLLQTAEAVHYDDDAQTLRERLHRIEHRLLPAAIDLLAAGRVELDGRIARVRDGEDS